MLAKMDFSIKKMLLGTIIIIGLVSPLTSIADKSSTKPTDKLPIKEVKKFTQAVDIIRNLYVEPVSDKDLLESAIEGMLETLDPHSTYLDEKEFSDLNVSTKGEFGGLGIEVTTEHGVVKVVAPIDDTPAAKAGVKAGDLIVKIDNKSIKGMSLAEAVKKMRGKKGTPIKITIIRVGETKPIRLTIIRDIIKVASVKSKIIDKNYGYIRISVFQSVTSKSLDQQIAKLEKDTDGKLKGVILDLRNNPGGVLQAAVAVADAFLDVDNLTENKKIVYTKGRLASSKFTGNVSTGDKLHGLPMVVLVNSGSASASEIVAGALQDHGRAIIMGIKTFGKGSVQTVLPLSKDTAVKLTTARYYTPKGQAIQNKGITPDIVVEEVNIPYDEEKITARQDWRLREADLKNSIERKEDKDKHKEIKQDESLSAKEQDEKLVKEFTKVGKGVVKEGGKPLLYEDYQLNEALNVLKAIVTLKRVK